MWMGVFNGRLSLCRRAGDGPQPDRLPVMESGDPTRKQPLVLKGMKLAAQAKAAARKQKQAVKLTRTYRKGADDVSWAGCVSGSAGERMLVAGWGSGRGQGKEGSGMRKGRDEA